MALNWNSNNNGKQFKANRQAAFAEKRAKMTSWKSTYGKAQAPEKTLENLDDLCSHDAY